MKLKDVGFFQRHLEKLVLGAAGVFALVILVMYVVADPYTVTLENRRLSPGEVPELVRDRAAQLEQRLNDDDPIGGAEQVPEVPELAPAFRQSLQPQTPRFVMAPIGVGPMPADEFEPPVGPDEPYYVPRPRMPENVVARAGNAALGERPQRMNARVYDQLVELVGHEEPRDFRYVSVDGEFNLDQWRRQLEQKPEDAEGLQLRRLWWARMVGVAGVYLQRQAYDPVTGEWGETVNVDPLPHQIAFQPTDRVDWGAERAQSAIRYLRENQPIVQRPDFVPTKHRPWQPPHQMPAPLDADQLAELRSINSQIERSRGRIESLERGLNIRPGQRRPGGSLSQRQEVRWQQLETERSRLEERLRERNELLGFDTVEEPRPRDPRARGQRQPGQWDDQWQDELQDPQWEDDIGGMAARGAPADRRRGGRGDAQAQTALPPWRQGADDEPQRPLSAEQEQRERIVRVWTHDLSVEPGRTYRYRLVVSVLNPLFRQDRVPDHQREQYFNRVALGPDEQTLAETPWTDPVQVAPESYFFLVGGSAENEIAEVELWRIYDGQWRRGEFRIRPGDPIAGTVEIQTDTGRRFDLDMAADALLVDLIGRTGGGGIGGVADSMRMLYLDQRHNIMADRSVNEDENSVERLRLESEIVLQRELGQQARAGN